MLIVLFSTHLLWAKQAVLPNFIQDAETSIMFVINQLWHRTLHNYRKTHTPMCFSLIYQPQNQDGKSLYIPCKSLYMLSCLGARKKSGIQLETGRRDVVIRWQKGSQGRYVHTRSGHQMTERKPRKKSTHCFHTSLPRCDSAAQRTCRKYWRRTQLCHHTCLYKKKKKEKDLLSHLSVQNKEHRFTVTHACAK